MTEFLHEALTILNYPIGTKKLHDIYKKGYGKSLEWKNLGLYPSTAAINIQRQMHENDKARQVPQVFNVADGMWNNGKKEAVTNWIVAWIPIALVDAIKTAQDLPRQHILDDKVIMGILLKVMRKASIIIFDRINEVPNGKPYLPEIYVDGLHPVMISNPKRVYSRTEPLTLTMIPPPPANTHFTGRWVQSETEISWAKYPNTGDNDQLIVPSNTPFNEEHWIGRKITEDSGPITDLGEAVLAMCNFRHTLGLDHNPDNPFEVLWPEEHKEVTKYTDIEIPTDHTPLRVTRVP